MDKYQVEMKYSCGDLELDDRVFDNYEDAEEYGRHLCSCFRLGSIVMDRSNPEGYHMLDDDVEFKVVCF